MNDRINLQLDNWQKKIFSMILDKYESSKTYRGEAKINQSFAIKPDKIYKDYYSDFADVDEHDSFLKSIAEIENVGLVSVERKQNEITSIVGIITKFPEYYQLLHRVDKNETIQKEIGFYRSYIGIATLIDNYCETQIALLEEGKKTKYSMDEVKMLIPLMNKIINNRDMILERELSMTVLGNSKTFENTYRNKVIWLLQNYGNIDSEILEIDDEREKRHTILEEYNIYSNPAYVYFKGEACICLINNEKMHISHNMPIALSSDSLKQINDFKIENPRIVTIENLSSFNRCDEDDTFYIYLAGYHNTARQKFLQMINKCNKDKSWYHFGDIDPDGFMILEHLKRKTEIDFKPLYMDIEQLELFKHYCKKLEANDVKKANTLIDKGDYVPIMHWMLKNNLKLEQEIISWSNKNH